jgi:hypothetical protein
LQLSVRSIIENNRRKTGEILQFPDNLGAHGMLLIFSKYKYEKSGMKQLLNSSDYTSSLTKESSSAIFLPIPANLEDNTQLRVERYDRSLGGEMFSDKLSELSAQNGANLGLGQLAKAYGSTIANFDTQKIVDAMLNADISTISKDAGYLLRSKLGSAGRNIDVALGNITNPKASLAFDGGELKNHNFMWNLMPRSENESENLRRIVERIKMNILPSYGNGLGLDKLFLNYPSTVDTFLFGVNNDYFQKYKTSMVRGFNVSYTPTGQLSVLKGGKPAGLQVTIDMMEMDLHTSEDYGGTSTSGEQFSSGGR